MTFLLVIISKLQKSPLERAIRIGVDFSFYSALTATILGYFLSLDDSYDIEKPKASPICRPHYPVFNLKPLYKSQTKRETKSFY